MNQFFKKIFYQFYVWGCRYNFANTPHLSAMYMLSLLLTFGLMGILHLISFLLTKTNSDISMVMAFTVVVLITFIIYECYTKKEKYKLIYKEFKDVSEKEKRNIQYISLTFILVSLFLFFGTAILIGQLKK